MNTTSDSGFSEQSYSASSSSNTTPKHCITDCSGSGESNESASPSGSDTFHESGPSKRYKTDFFSETNPRVLLTHKPLFIKFRCADFGHSYVLEPYSCQSTYKIKPDDAIDKGMYKEKEVWIPVADFELKLLKMFRLAMNLKMYSHMSAFQVINPHDFNSTKDTPSEEGATRENESLEGDFYDEEEEQEEYDAKYYDNEDDDYVPYQVGRCITGQRCNKRNKHHKASIMRKRKDALNMGDDGLYHCPFCPRTFQMGQQLGGHCSRAHPGQSQIYREKMEKRQKYYAFLQKCKVEDPKKAYRKHIRKL